MKNKKTQTVDIFIYFLLVQTNLMQDLAQKIIISSGSTILQVSFLVGQKILYHRLDCRNSKLKMKKYFLPIQFRNRDLY